jgi:hypothetical protein
MPNGGFANPDANAASTGASAVPKGSPVIGLIAIRWIRLPSALV